MSEEDVSVDGGDHAEGIGPGGSNYCRECSSYFFGPHGHKNDCSHYPATEQEGDR